MTPSPTMRALVVRSHAGGAGSLELAEVPVPTPRAGQVLVRVAYAPVNPNDLLALRDAYEVKRPVGSIAGFEGSGTVMAGDGLQAWFLRGRRVAFSGDTGSWAEYAVADGMKCLPLRGAVDDVQGATLLTNPLTATVLVDQARREGHRAVVQAAAAGALGTMIARLALELGLVMVHVVRSEAQVAALRALGAQHVLDSTREGFEAELGALCKRLHATLALDPVAGPMTGTLLRALEDGGVVRVYGWLSGVPSSFDPNEVVFRGKRVDGFTMYDWVRRTSAPRQLWTALGAQARLRSALATEVRLKAPLADFRSALEAYERSMSGGKILFDARG